MPQKVTCKRKIGNYRISMVGMTPGVFFIWGDSEQLYRKIGSVRIEGAEDGVPNCMRMQDGELIHLPFSSLVEAVDKVTIHYE